MDIHQALGIFVKVKKMAFDHGVTLQQFPSRAVKAYSEVELSRLDRKLTIFRSLCAEDRQLLPEFEKRLSSIAECIESNARLLSQMAKSAQTIHSPTSKTPIPDVSELPLDCTDDEKQALSREARRGLLLLARDWSFIGADERAACYQPLIQSVENSFREASRATRSLSRDQFRVLVPGAAAGRLPWELVKRGFAVEGCEASFTALLVGNFALNSASEEEMKTLYPFAHEHSNVRRAACAVRGVHVPDVNPKDIPAMTDFAMRAGSFVEAYDGQDNAWDAVVSCLAFDLGDGVIEHVRRVSQILKPGGMWSFVGPMPCLDGGQGNGIHLSVAEFMAIIRKSGFKIIKQDVVRCLHSNDPESMRTVSMECPFLVGLKVRPAL